jgi:threonylcarbamoyladenosine tRNA methylthiotransferase MtaB
VPGRQRRVKRESPPPGTPAFLYASPAVLRFLLTTLGCKVNQYDGQAIAAELRRAGLCCARTDAPPELVVINTCCVTATAMRKSRQAIRRAVRAAPHAAVLVTGCYSDYDARRIHALLAELHVPADRVLLAGHHEDLASRIKELALRLCRRQPLTGCETPGRSGLRARHGGKNIRMNASCDARITASPSTIRTRRQAAVKANVPGTAGLGPLSEFAGHQRAFVKVQDGCDAFCRYCIVPYTRPRLWSRSPEQILAECRRLLGAGHREIVLCGVFLGAFGRPTAVRRRWDDAPAPLVSLLRRVAALDGLWRVRLSSLEPGDVTDDLLRACRECPNVAPHFHLPLQSGSDRILRRMNRQYAADEFRRTVDRLRDALDRPTITTDVIAGFPGETDADFADTLDALRHAGAAKVHAFPFSPIEGTAAWPLRGEAAAAPTVRRRMAELADLERELAAAFRRQFVGEQLEGLVERTPPDDGPTRRAMTDRYLTVEFDAQVQPGKEPARRGDLTGRIVRLRIDRVTSAGLAGTLLETSRS